MPHRPRTLRPASLSRRQLLSLMPALGVLSLLPRPAGASAALHAATLSAGDAADVQRIETCLNGIKTLQARFDQVAGDGSSAAGMLYLERPGHLRIVYDPPASILMVATGGEIYYYDPKLDQLSQIDVSDTPAWFLLKDNISFGDGVVITDFKREPAVLRLTLVEARNPERGRVSMVLSDKPLELRQWTITDAQNKAVTVSLNDPHYGVALDPNLFNWTSPRPSGGQEH